MKRRAGGPLGLLQLQNSPRLVPGSISNPETFAFSLLCKQVPGAWVENVVEGGPEVQAAFVAAAGDLARKGAVAITTNCGFTLRFQSAMASAVSVPVATSSLLLLPYVTRVTSGRVGILTVDAGSFTPDLLRTAGVGDEACICMAGLEGTSTQKAMARPSNDYDVGEMTEELLFAVRRLRERHPDVAALLFECAEFTPSSVAIRRQTGLPVYDARTNADLLMHGVVATHDPRSSGARSERSPPSGVQVPDRAQQRWVDRNGRFARSRN